MTSKQLIRYARKALTDNNLAVTKVYHETTRKGKRLKFCVVNKDDFVDIVFPTEDMLRHVREAVKELLRMEYYGHLYKVEVGVANTKTVQRVKPGADPLIVPYYRRREVLLSIHNHFINSVIALRWITCKSGYGHKYDALEIVIPKRKRA